MHKTSLTLKTWFSYGMVLLWLIFSLCRQAAHSETNTLTSFLQLGVMAEQSTNMWDSPGVYLPIGQATQPLHEVTSALTESVFSHCKTVLPPYVAPLFSPG